jgi:Anaphase-promoting complex, cyclosome, subunit 4/Anaphase-promoting complex subunit 4 WD40 domain
MSSDNDDQQFDDEQSFRVLVEKGVAADVEQLSWCPTMDVLCVMSSNQCYLQRAGSGDTWSRVVALQAMAKVQKNSALDGAKQQADRRWTCVAWRPDGKAIACGYATGHLAIFDVEQGNTLFCARIFDNDDAVRALVWRRQEHVDDCSGHRQSMLPLYDDDVQLPLLASIDDNDDDDDEATSQSSSLSSSATSSSFSPSSSSSSSTTCDSLDILIAQSASGSIELRAHGMFQVGAIAADDSGQSSDVLSMCLNGDGSRLGIAAAASDDGALSLRDYDTRLLAERRAELAEIARRARDIHSLFAYVDAALLAVKERWEAAARALLKELGALDRALAAHSLRLDGSAPSIEEEMLAWLLSGRASDGVRQWLFQGVTERGISRLAKQLDEAGKRVASVALLRVRPACEHLVAKLSTLAALAAWRDRFGALGFDAAPLDKLVGDARALLERVEALLLGASALRRDHALFFLWLARAAAKLEEGSQRPVRGPAVDVSHVASLLADNLAPIRAAASVQRVHEPVVEAFDALRTRFDTAMAAAAVHLQASFTLRSTPLDCASLDAGAPLCSFALADARYIVVPIAGGAARLRIFRCDGESLRCADARLADGDDELRIENVCTYLYDEDDARLAILLSSPSSGATLALYSLDGIDFESDGESQRLEASASRRFEHVAPPPLRLDVSNGRGVASIYWRSNRLLLVDLEDFEDDDDDDDDDGE